MSGPSRQEPVHLAVLLSGGMDSTTVLARAVHENAERGSVVEAISVNYGQRHSVMERASAAEVVSYYRRMGVEVRPHGLSLPNIFSGGASSLMGDRPLVKEEYTTEEEGPNETEVPFRNANLISAAVTVALLSGATQLWMGMHATDHGAWAYPDCSPEFLGAMANAVYIGTFRRVRLVFPFLWMTKADVVKEAYRVGAPLDLTWSCYEGKEVHCGQCATCRERIKAFRAAGFADPVKYKLPVTTGAKSWDIPGGFPAEEDRPHPGLAGRTWD